MEEQLISIVVPVYNVAPYLAKCLDSICCQSYANWEPILVDDGSTDSTGEICDAYLQKDERIKVVHIPNGGVSHARNIALNLVRGEWITFVDGDDWAGEDYLLNLYKPISENKQIEFVQGACQIFREDQSCGIMHQFRFLVGTDPLYLLNHFRGISNSKLFKTYIVKKNNILFDESVKIGEDYLFTLDYIKYVHCYCFCDSVSYYYRYRESSASNSLNNIWLIQKMNHVERHVALLVQFLTAYSFPYDSTPIRWGHASSNLFNVIHAKGLLCMDKNSRKKCHRMLSEYPLIKYQPKLGKKLYLVLFKWFNSINLIVG